MTDGSAATLSLHGLYYISPWDNLGPKLSNFQNYLASFNWVDQPIHVHWHLWVSYLQWYVIERVTSSFVYECYIPLLYWSEFKVGGCLIASI